VGQDELAFTVEYDHSLCRLNKGISGYLGKMPAFDDNVSAEDAWGGYLAFIRQQQIASLPQAPPFHYSWIVPNTRVKEVRSTADSTQMMPPLLKMVVEPGFLLEFEVKRSSIPQAGLGLWVTCSPASILLRDCLYFELPPGTFVDLGIYAPLQETDRKTDNASLLKNFVHNWECEGWSFEMATHEKGEHFFDVFDITDDRTGALHSEAKNNTIVYVNESKRGDSKALAGHTKKQHQHTAN